MALLRYLNRVKKTIFKIKNKNLSIIYTLKIDNFYLIRFYKIFILKKLYNISNIVYIEIYTKKP